MTELDRQIEEALNAEDRALMARFGEQNLWAQAFSVYGGKQGWIGILATIFVVVPFVGAIYGAYKFFGATEAVEMVKWGIAVWFLVTMVAFMKLWFWMRMESNRILREVKRVELQLARLQGKQSV